MNDWETKHARAWENDTESVVSSRSDDEESSQNSVVEGRLVSVAGSVVSTLPPRPVVHQVLNQTHAARNPVPLGNTARRANGTLANAGAAGRSYLAPVGQSGSVPRSTSNPQMGSRQYQGNTGAGNGGRSANSGENVPPRGPQQPPGGANRGRSQSATQGGNPQENLRASTNNPVAKDNWAVTPGLVTTKRAAYNVYTERRTQERDQYLQAPPRDEPFPSIGTYLWPYHKQTPVDLFGSKLAPLAAVRTENEVFIECVTTSDNVQVLRISSRIGKQDFAPVFDGIRRAVQGAKARDISATPTYIFVPPTTDAIRKFVKPEVYQTMAPMKATAFVLDGDSLTPGAKAAWKMRRPAMVAENQREFQAKLIAGLKGLEPLKGWMRMRVTFGHVEIRNFRTPFVEGNYSFEEFVDMVKHPRQVGSFEKKIGDGETAIKMREKVVAWPDKFVPASGRTISLKDVRFKDTVILFVKIVSTGEELRLEAEIDRIWEKEQSEFQAGSVRLFFKEKTHKSLNITTVDLEREMDWQLEVITDSERFEVPSRLHELITQSVNTKSTVRRDAFGLDYPHVAPTVPSGILVTTTVVRSVTQYKFLETGFILEIAIFREWDGAKTGSKPILKTSVSMFHPEWDTQLESIEHTTRVRDFGPGLIHLFNGDPAWLEPFLDQVSFAQGLLVDVTKAIKVESAAKSNTAASKAIADAADVAQDVAAQISTKKPKV